MKDFDLCIGLMLFLIIICGIVGNVLSLLVWTKGRRCKKLPGGVYLRALAVSDTTALCIPALNEAISLVTSFNPKEDNTFLCKLEIVGRHFGLMVSSWIIVCFTIERTVFILRPTGTTCLLNKKGTICLMVTIFLVNFCLNLPYGLVHETRIVTELDSELGSNFSESLGNASFIQTTMVTDAASKKQCLAPRSSFFHYSNWYHTWFMDVFLIFIIPFSLMTGSNLIVLYLVVSRKRATMMTKVDIKAVTMRAVTISVMHCVTSGAFSMSVLIPGFLTTAFSVKYSQEYYISKITLLLAHLNHAINFLLYSVFGSDFRHDCAKIIRKRPTIVNPDPTTGETELRRQ